MNSSANKGSKSGSMMGGRMMGDGEEVNGRDKGETSHPQLEILEVKVGGRGRRNSRAYEWCSESVAGRSEDAKATPSLQNPRCT